MTVASTGYRRRPAAGARGMDKFRLVKTNRNYLSAADRADLVAIFRDGLEENRVSRRANAILLLDRGWSFAEMPRRC